MKTSVSRRAFLASSAGVASLAGTAQAAEHGTAPDDATMPLRPLGRLGWMVSVVGFGGGSRFMVQEDMEEVERMIDTAVARGICYFDTAYVYQKNGVRESQQRYGRFLTPKYRDQITLVTKLKTRDAETAKRQLDESLADLKTDHVDLLHFHALGSTDDTDQIVAKGSVLELFRKWKEEGIIRAIGVTAHGDADMLLDAMKRIEPDCVMCPLNPAHNGRPSNGCNGVSFAGVVMPYALENGIGMVAMKATGRETLIGKNGITAEELVRYILTMPAAAAVIGMPTEKIVKSNTSIARTLKPMSEEERETLIRRIAKTGAISELPYLASGYVDGEIFS